MQILFIILTRLSQLFLHLVTPTCITIASVLDTSFITKETVVLLRLHLHLLLLQLLLLLRHLLLLLLLQLLLIPQYVLLLLRLYFYYSYYFYYSSTSLISYSYCYLYSCFIYYSSYTSIINFLLVFDVWHTYKPSSTTTSYTSTSTTTTTNTAPTTISTSPTTPKALLPLLSSCYSLPSYYCPTASIPYTSRTLAPPGKCIHSSTCRILPLCRHCCFFFWNAP